MKRLLVIGIIGMMVICGTVASQAARGKVSYIGEKETNQEQEVKRKVDPRQCGQAKNPIRVASFETNPPFGWVDLVSGGIGVSDKYFSNGFSVGVFRQIAESHGLFVQPVGFPSYEAALRALSRGEIDVFAGAYYDPHIGQMGNSFVTPSFFQNAIVAVFLKGKEKPVHRFEDLIGMKGVVRRDEHFYELLYKGLPNGLTIRPVPDAREAFRMLMTGEADYMLSSPYAAEAEARRFKMDQMIELSDRALFGPELFFVFSLNSDCRGMRSVFSQFIREAKVNQEEWQRMLISYIDQWGQRFKDSPGLDEQIRDGVDEVENGGDAVSVTHVGLESGAQMAVVDLKSGGIE